MFLLLLEKTVTCLTALIFIENYNKKKERVSSKLYRPERGLGLSEQRYT